MALARRQLSVTILVEDDEDAIRRTVGFIKTSVKGSCRNLNSGTVILGLYDEDDRLVGLDVTGKPSHVLQEQMEELFDGDNLEHLQGGD